MDGAERLTWAGYLPDWSTRSTKTRAGNAVSGGFYFMTFMYINPILNKKCFLFVGMTRDKNKNKTRKSKRTARKL